jgi:hypothetical protein
LPEGSPGQQFARQGWRFIFEGVNLRDVPDALSPTKYACALNIRATSRQSIRTRPGYVPLFNIGSPALLTDIKAFATLGTDDTPRLLVRAFNDGIFMDTGLGIGTMAGPHGLGVVMLPFRPGASPQSFMYIAGLSDYIKLSAPDALNNIIQYKVGIAEPQFSLDAVPESIGINNFTQLANAWTTGGTASGLADATRSTDTAGAVIADPILSTRLSVQVGTGIQYQIGELLAVGANQGMVQDVLPPIPATSIASIYYNTGSTGQCTITPNQLPIGSEVGVPDLGALRRGAIVKLGTEAVLVLDSTLGPDGTMCFTTVTVGSYTAGQAMTGVPTVVVDVAVSTGNTLTATAIAASVATGIGTLSQALSTNPFTQRFSQGGPSVLPQEDDYLHISIFVDTPTNLLGMQLVFNVDATVDYKQNVYYTSIQPNIFAPVIAGLQTPLQAELGTLIQTTSGLDLPDQTDAGINQWTEILVPISSLTQVGGDASRTLAQCNGVQLQVNASGPVNVKISSLWIGGGSQPDVGDAGAPYRYRAVPRASVSGARGNPTPPMRYGVSPRRQQVKVTLPSSFWHGDLQIDTYDIYRYGGSVNSYRFIGSIANPQTVFEDDLFDDAATKGSLIEADNFEPWPSVDLPFKANTPGGGGTAVITFSGVWIIVSNVTFPATVANWLAGSLIEFESQPVYTLRKRPTQLAANSWLFETVECISPATNSTYFLIQEPVLGRQILPYIWGPDVQGSFFGVGDPLRPGTVSFSKSNQPDAAPDSYNLDLCPPSEPLIGGQIKAGVSLVASTTRWWALYPAFNTAQRYNAIEQPVGRGLIAPYGHCTDGSMVYFWAKDGICMTNGGPFKSLTDEDLYNLFPHEGVRGVDVTRNGVTYHAPDYSRAGSFRLNKVNQYLFADYLDGSQIQRTLVCDLRTGGWSQDQYANSLTVHYQPEQQSGGLSIDSGTLYVAGVMADNQGNVYQEQDCTNDNGIGIVCNVSTFEWDGGDLRMQPLFGDTYIDLSPVSPVNVTPTTLGSTISPPTIITAGNARVFQPVSISTGELQKFLGLQITWTEV